MRPRASAAALSPAAAATFARRRKLRRRDLLQLQPPPRGVGLPPPGAGLQQRTQQPPYPGVAASTVGRTGSVSIQPADQQTHHDSPAARLAHEPGPDELRPGFSRDGRACGHHRPWDPAYLRGARQPALQPRARLRGGDVRGELDRAGAWAGRYRDPRSRS